MSSFSERLVLLRNEKGITQEKFADIIGVSKSTVSMYENGNRTPSFEIEEKIADYFNVDLEFLRGRSNIKNRYQYEKQKSERDLMIEKYQLNPEELAEYDRIMKLSIEMNTLMFQSNNIELEVEDKEEMDYELSETLKKAFISSLITKRKKEKKE